MKIAFEIPGKATPKARGRTVRPKSGKVRTYTPDPTVNYEKLVRYTYWQKYMRTKFPDDAALSMEVLVFHPIPKRTSLRKQELMKAEKLRPTVKPDLTNIAKSIEDALNGLAYRDDSQIVESHIRKYYSDVPRVYVEITQIG